MWNISYEFVGHGILQAEHALPQQYVHEFKDGRFETAPVSHSGG